MISFLNYEYYIEKDKCAASGEYFLYKNELLTDSYANKHYKYTNHNATDSLEIYVGTTPPVAFGITAFFYCGVAQFQGLYSLLSRGIKFKSVEYYEVYYSLASKKAFAENDSNPEPKSHEEVHCEFLTQHIISEQKHLESSEIFYSEPNDNIRMEVKNEAKKYVKAYIKWLTGRLDNISQSIKSDVSGTKNNKHLAPTNKSLILASDLSPIEFITTIEKILTFIYGCFRDQAYPEQRPYFIWLPEALAKKDIGYNYYFHLDSEFFNFYRFDKLIRGLLIDNSTNAEGLKTVLKSCFEASKENTALYDTHLQTKKNEEYYSIYLEFDSNSGQIIHLLSPEKEKYFTQYSNSEFHYYSSQIYSFLKRLIFTDILESKTPSTSQKDDLSVLPLEKEQNNQPTSGNNSNHQGNNEPNNSSNNKSISNILSDLFNNSDIKSIDVLETILDTINYLFRDQAYPESRDSFTHFLRLPKGEKTYYCYLIDNGNQIINFLMFKEKLRSLMLRSDIDKSELKKILNKSYSDAKSNIQIFTEHIEPEKLPMEKNLLLQFDFKKLSFSVLNNQPVSFSPAFYTNQRLANFSVWIAEFLEEEVYFNEAVSKTQSTVNRIESPMKTNPQIIAVSYFNRIESFLQKIVELFYLQLDPAMKAIRADQLGIGFNHDTDCEYFIPPSTNLLDFTYFKDNFGFLLLQKKKEDEGLQMLLSETFNLCTIIISLYEDRLGNLRQVNTVHIFFQDINGEINYYHDEKDPADGYEILGNYEVYHYSLKIYEYMISKGFTPLSTTISSGKTNPLVADGASLPKLPDAEKIINLSDESETTVDPEQFISDILEPLTKENFTVGKNKKLVYCIDSSFKNHLASCFLALIEDTERPKYHPQFKIRSQNAPFYDAILLIKEKFQFKTMDVIIIIADSFNKDFDDLSKGAPNTIRNEISYAKTRKLRKNI